VNDEDSAPTELVAAALKKPNVSARLRQIAMWSTKSEADADDLVGAALVRVINPDDSPWDPRRRTFLTHMSFVMRQTWDRRMRKLSVQNEVLDDGLAPDENTVSAGPRPDDELHRLRLLALQRLLGQRLLAELNPDDALARAIFDLCSREDLEQGEQADRLGCTVDEIRAAHKRLARLGRTILDEWEAAEQRRMKALREQVKEPMNEDTP
jgi:DNA-directed RNA polymerase specialized sigma24 family protein